MGGGGGGGGGGGSNHLLGQFVLEINSSPDPLPPPPPPPDLPLDEHYCCSSTVPCTCFLCHRERSCGVYSDIVVRAALVPIVAVWYMVIMLEVHSRSDLGPIR